MIKLCILIYWR